MFKVLNLLHPSATPTLEVKNVVDLEVKTEVTHPSRLEKIMITDDMEAAIEQCRRTVQTLARECRAKNRRYRDIEFNIVADRGRVLNPAIKSTEAKYTPYDARRVAQIFDNPEFFAENAEPSSNVACGDDNNNSSFLGAAGLAATAGLIQRICVEMDQEIGIYGFVFWLDGGWREVIIDDLLFSKLPRWELLTTKEQSLWQNNAEKYNNSSRRGGLSVYFSYSKRPNETWVSLLEKAYAKLYGDYWTISTMYPATVVEDFTGALASVIYIDDILDVDKFWEEELVHTNIDRMFSVAIETRADTGYTSNKCLATGEYYYIVKALTVNSKRFVLMRNPWGTQPDEWAGRWSDGSLEWTSEWLTRLNNGDFGGYRFGQHGHFIMEYCDFLETWNTLKRFKLFDSSWSLNQFWLVGDLGPHPCAWDYGDVSFTVSIPKPTPAVIALVLHSSTDVDPTWQTPFWYSIDFAIYRSGELDPVATSPQSNSYQRNVNIELTNLEPGDYVVHVRFDRWLKLFPSPPPSATGSLDISAAPNSKLIVADARKLAFITNQYLQSCKVAKNFPAWIQVPNMAMPRGTFSGKDLTEMELELHSEMLRHKKVIKATFSQPAIVSTNILDAPSSPATENGELLEIRASGKSKAVQSTFVNLVGQEAQMKDVCDTDATGKQSGNSRIEDSFDSISSNCLHSPGPETEDLFFDALENTELAPLDTCIQSPSPVSHPEHSNASFTRCPSASTAISGPCQNVPSNVHLNVFCKGCDQTITGIRFKCLDVVCPQYDLCSRCMAVGAHVKDHRFLEIPTLDDDLYLSDLGDGNNANRVTVGLRVYTHKTAPAIVKGQVRHGQLIRKYLSTPTVV